MPVSQKSDSEIELPSNPVPKARNFTILRLVPVAILLAVAADFLFIAVTRKTTSLPDPAVLPASSNLHELRAMVRESPRSPDLQLGLAGAYLRLKHYLSARDHFHRALAAGADEYAVCTGRAEAAIALERYDLAGMDIERLITLRPNVLEPYLTLAEIQQHSDDWKAARATLDRVPRDVDGLPKGDIHLNKMEQAELLATAYSHIDAWDAARILINRCLEIEPARISSRIMRGKILHATGKPAEAIPYLQEGLKVAPKNAELHYLLGTAYRARGASGDGELAFRSFQAAVFANHLHGAATLEMARECEKRKLYGPAAFAYMRAYKLGMEGARPMLKSGEMMLASGNREEGWFRRGVYYEAVNRPDVALKEYERLATLHNCCRSGWMHMSRAYALMKQPKKAVEYLVKARALEPARAKELDWRLIEALGDTKDDTQRIAMLKQIATEPGKDGTEACFQLGKIAESAGKYAEAEDWYLRCIQAEPKIASHHFELGRLLLQQRQDPAKLKRALTSLEEAVRLAPENRNGVYALGLAYSYSGRVEDAVITLRHAIDLQPENGEGYPALAQALSQTGRKSEAAEVQTVYHRFETFAHTRETLEARCKRDPMNPVAQLRMAEFHMRAHEYPGAIERYGKYLLLKPDDRQARARLADAYSYLGRRDDQRQQLAILNKPAGASL